MVGASSSGGQQQRAAGLDGESVREDRAAGEACLADLPHTRSPCSSVDTLFLDSFQGHTRGVER